MPNEIEDLTLVVVFPGEGDVGTVEAFQYFESNQLPPGSIEVRRPLSPKASAGHGARFYLKAFVLTYPAGGYRISNVVPWTAPPSSK